MIIGVLLAVSIVSIHDNTSIAGFICSLLIFLAFTWLAWETNWFTVRLPYGKPSLEMDITDLISVAIGMITYIIVDDLVNILIGEPWYKQVGRSIRIKLEAILYILSFASLAKVRHKTENTCITDILSVTDPITRKLIHVDKRTGRIIH